MNDKFNYASRAKDTVLHFLQTVFSKSDLFVDQKNPFLYSSDEKVSRIMISDWNTENLNSVNIKPAILVMRGSMSPSPLSIGDRTKDTFLAGYEQREILMNVGITVNCYSREGLEAEALAVVVFKLFRYLNEDIQKRYKIFNIASLGIGPEQTIKRESTSEIVGVPVSLSISVPDMVQINFKNIQISRLNIENGESTVQLEAPIS